MPSSGYWAFDLSLFFCRGLSDPGSAEADLNNGVVVVQIAAAG